MNLYKGNYYATNDYYGAVGNPDADEDEDITDLENSDLTDVGGVPAADQPKYRELVRAKKLAMKAQYGKWSWKKPLVRGWRYYWKDFKRSGGLAQLKIEAKTPVTLPSLPTNTGGGSNGRGAGSYTPDAGAEMMGAMPEEKSNKVLIWSLVGVGGLIVLGTVGYFIFKK